MAHFWEHQGNSLFEIHFLRFHFSSIWFSPPPGNLKTVWMKDNKGKHCHGVWTTECEQQRVNNRGWTTECHPVQLNFTLNLTKCNSAILLFKISHLSWRRPHQVCLVHFPSSCINVDEESKWTHGLPHAWFQDPHMVFHNHVLHICCSTCDGWH